MHVIFQVAVEILIGVMFRAVRRQKENFDLLLVFLQPGRNDLAMMNSEIVKNEKHLLTNVFYQTGHEFDKEDRGHCFSIQHESNFAGIGNRRDHVDATFLGIEPNYRRLPFRSESLGGVSGILDARLVAQ